MSEHFDDDFAFFDQKKNLNAGSIAPTRAGIERERKETNLIYTDFRTKYKQINVRLLSHMHTFAHNFVYLK